MQLIARYTIGDFTTFRTAFDADAEDRGLNGLSLLQLWRESGTGAEVYTALRPCVALVTVTNEPDHSDDEVSCRQRADRDKQTEHQGIRLPIRVKNRCTATDACIAR